MRKILLCLIMILISSCSLQKMALRSAAPMFEKSTQLVTHESNWEFFKESSPGNLKFLELLSLQDQDNLALLGVLIKSYSGYAYGVKETLLFQDEMNQVEDSVWKKDAIFFYGRAFDYGLVYLSKKNINPFTDDLDKKLDSLSESDLVAILYTAQAWGTLINLQKDNMELVSQVPRVKSMFDWVCRIRPNIDDGVCDIFFAQYEASRPRMLGGNPEKAHELYAKAIEKNPKNLLIRLNYIQYSLLPGFDAEKYEAQAKVLKVEFEKFQSGQYKDVPQLNLYNAIAKKRFEAIELHKSKIF